MATTKKPAAQQAAAEAEIEAEAELAGLPVEEALDNPDEVDPYLPADAGKKNPDSPAVNPVPATTLDIPASEPYPVGKPQEPSYLEINGLVPPAAAEEA